MTTIHKTEVGSTAKHKVTYEYRGFLGLIGSWKEIRKEAVGLPSIHIVTTTPDFSGVFVNGKEYVPLVVTE